MQPNHDAEMKKVQVVSRKYDGSLRDAYETCLYAETAESVTLFSLPGGKAWDYRKQAWVTAADGLLEIYFKDRWYNVWHICEQVSGANLIYVNVAMPASITPTTLTWIDLDLDYRLHLDGSVEQVDQADFQQNAQQMGYPTSVISQVEAACREVEAGLVSQRYPFDHARQVVLYRQIKAARQAGKDG